MWKTLSKNLVFNGRVKLFDHKVRVDNELVSDYLVEESNGSAGVLIFDKEKKDLIFTKEYRYPINKEIFNIVGGAKKDISEDSKTTAKREMLEETGLKALEITYLGKFCPNPARMNWFIDLYFCSEFESIDGAKEDDIEEKTTLCSYNISDFETKILLDLVDPGLIIAYTLAKNKKLI